MKAHSQTIDSMIENFDISKITEEEKVDMKPVTFWVPTDLKLKYDKIQKRSKQKFGKLLKKVVMKSIEKVKVDD